MNAPLPRHHRQLQLAHDIQRVRAACAEDPNLEPVYQAAVWTLAMTVQGLTRQLATKAPLLGIEDATQAGLLGAYVAAERFDPDRGLRFSTYAKWWIRAYINKAVQSARPVRLPSDPAEHLRRGRHLPPGLTRSEEAARLGCTLDLWETLRPWLGTPASLDANYGDGSPLRDQLPGETDPEAAFVQALDDASRAEGLWAAIEALPPVERDCIVRYYGLGGFEADTLAGISRSWGKSRERARQIHTAALWRLERRLAS